MKVAMRLHKPPKHPVIHPTICKPLFTITN